MELKGRRATDAPALIAMMVPRGQNRSRAMPSVRTPMRRQQLRLQRLPACRQQAR
jgi:hypothetical protein